MLIRSIEKKGAFTPEQTRDVFVEAGRSLFIAALFALGATAGPFASS
jgi:hypothetical protein